MAIVDTLLSDRKSENQFFDIYALFDFARHYDYQHIFNETFFDASQYRSNHTLLNKYSKNYRHVA